MRKSLIISLCLIAITGSSCLKDTPATDLSHEGTIIEMVYPAGGAYNAIGSGLEFFTGQLLEYPGSDITDTITGFVNIAGTNTLNTNLTTTLTVNPSLLEANYSTDSITYQIMPDSDYTIIGGTGNIPAGSRMDTFQVAFYPSKFDLTKNLMVPIAVTTTPSYTIAGNFGTVYFHTIGIAGNYVVSGTRYNYVGSSGWSGKGAYPTPASSVNLGTTVATETANLLGTAPLIIGLGFGDSATTNNYAMQFTYDPNQILSNQTFVAVPNSALGAANNFTIWTSTLVFEGKAVFHVVASYTNTAGNDAIVDETFTQQ